uniref:Uncharacterized protein n=1 Tax=Globisporangium ultimum (strain ATCC 200006 / CBS 805.95 / DAOM BR144) TaxID=431595 RepID=K3WF73_GLOUD
MNAIVSSMVIFQRNKQMGLLEMLIDAIFDFLVAVGSPMFVVFYSLSTFCFDKKQLQINNDVFQKGSFDAQARVIVDPAQMDSILKTLNWLRIRWALDFFTRVGANLALEFHLRKLTTMLRSPRLKHPTVYPKRSPMALVYCRDRYLREHVRFNERPLVERKCAVYALCWSNFRDGECPCLTMIDRDVAPRTYTKWLLPNNVTEKVSRLTATGDLQTLQLINRYLPGFPDELRRCTMLKHMYVDLIA